MSYDPADAYYAAKLENPLTAFLAEIPRGEKFREKLSKDLPPFPSDAVRARSVPERLRLNANLSAFHVPLGRDIEMAETILELLDQSYASRRPTPKLISERSQIAKTLACDVLAGGGPQNEAIGRALIGTPGAGKTRTVSRILDQIPQVIAHDLKRHPLLLPKMVTWIRVETPANRKLSALCENIITAIGAAVGDDYSSLKRGNVSVKIQNTAMLCMELHVGVIVIDEIQHILRKGNVPDLELSNFLVELSNRLSIPLLLIGTPQAEFVAAGIARQSRRMLGPRWDPLDRKSETWSRFVKQLLGYQFTKLVATHDELEPTIFDLSQGLPVIAVAVLQFAQRSALLLEIETGKSTKITEAMLRAAFTRYMRPVALMVAALREGDRATIAMWQDLAVDAQTVEAMLMDQADERKMRNAQKIMRVAMGVSPCCKKGLHNWRRDAN